jgi:hypothetical protein
MARKTVRKNNCLEGAIRRRKENNETINVIKPFAGVYLRPKFQLRAVYVIRLQGLTVALCERDSPSVSREIPHGLCTLAAVAAHLNFLFPTLRIHTYNLETNKLIVVL